MPLPGSCSSTSRLGERVGLFTRALSTSSGLRARRGTGVKRSSSLWPTHSTASTRPVSSARTPMRLTMPVHWAPARGWRSLAVSMRCCTPK